MPAMKVSKKEFNKLVIKPRDPAKAKEFTPLTIEQIAERTGLKPGTVGVRLSALREWARQHEDKLKESEIVVAPNPGGRGESMEDALAAIFGDEEDSEVNDKELAQASK
jgi:hypothetical protein